MNKYKVRQLKFYVLMLWGTVLDAEYNSQPVLEDK